MFLADEKRGNALVNKYKAMADARRDYEEIDISDCVPTLNEMLKDDLMYEILEDASNGKTEQDVLNTAYYTEGPPITTLGYNSQHNVFILKVVSVPITERMIDLNEIDGDTLSIPLDSIIDTSTGNSSFKMKNGEEYKSFKDYCIKKGIANNDKSNIQLRHIGIDCPEIPHYSVQVMKEKYVVTMTLEEAKKKNAVIQKYNYNGKTVSDRKSSDKLKLYKINNSYHEIVESINGKTVSGDKYISSSDKRDGYVYNVIVSKDETKKENLAGGYKAKENLINQIKNKTIYLMLDANGLTANITTSKYKLYYNHFWHVGKAIGDMIDQWQDSIGGEPLTKLTYAPYGIDAHGRFIGAIYSKHNDMWINIGKFNAADSETKTITNHNFINSPELENLGGDNSNIFELWSYEKNNNIWVDSFSEMTKESYTNRINFHKEVTGLDFTKLRNCTMLIGDTLMLIPPQNIRSLSSIDYEKVGIMRGKGSMVKNNTNRNMFLEVDLFFYNDEGINGIPKEVRLPSGDKVTYYMDGLRSLIAQFKVAPYLPIENEYINDVLGIEAVSLVNLHVSTVEGFPKLLQATLTLRDFNYRIYMPDVPIDYESNQVSELSKMNPIFAKCFNWEVFRYYYQRMINYGQAQSKLQYNTKEYNTELYSKKEVLQPIEFCNKSSNISFYTPDENWLKTALKYKKDKDSYGYYPDNNKTKEEFDDKSIEKNTIIKVDGGDLSGNREPNVKVNIGFGDREYWSYTNSYSQVVKVTAKKIILQDDSKEPVNSDGRYYDDEAKVPGVERKDMSEGHIVADSLGGVANAYNITPQNNILNQKGKIYEIEDKIRKAGGCTDFTAIITYPNTSTQIPEHYKYTFTINGKVYNEEFYNTSTGIQEQQQEDVRDVYDYLNPAAMQFIAYLEDVELQNISFNLSNSFSDITLKVMDGFAPQYMGSSDITIEASFITNDAYVVSVLNVLPAHASNIGKLYRRILSCWPIKVKNQYLQLAGVNEVLIDVIEVQTVEGFPGTYEVKLRMTSVDRTMRQKETMRQLESDKTSGSLATSSMRSYWDLNNVLANAEVYPDLDLPSIKELSKYGFNFLRYKNTKQAYPDPDFYMTYAYPYTSYIIKKNLKDFFYKDLFHDQDKDKAEILDDTNYEFFDTMGMYMYRKLDPYKGTTEGKNSEGKSQNDLADTYDEAIETIDSAANETIKKNNDKNKNDIENEKNCKDLSELLIYLTACDVQDGWTLKPGFKAPLCATETNFAVEKLSCSGISSENNTETDKNNQFAKDIFDIRAEAIKAIDDYLSSPINYSKYRNNDALAYAYYGKGGVESIIDEVVKEFAQEAKGKKILQLLNPLETSFSVDKYSKNNKFNNAKTLNFLSGFLHASARTISAKHIYNTTSEEDLWEAQQYLTDEHGLVVRDKKNNKIPNCKVELEGKPLRQADSLEEALNYGVQWGCFQIKRYRASELREMMQPTSKVTYLSKEQLPMYKDPKTNKERWHPGFIDPYYNIAGYKSSIGKEYIKEISTSIGVNTIAFLRVTLMHLRRMIIDGLIFSEIDVIAKDYDDISNQILASHVSGLENLEAIGQEALEGVGDLLSYPIKFVNELLANPLGAIGKLGYDIGSIPYNLTVGYLDDVSTTASVNSLTDILGSEDDANTVVKLLEDMPETYKKSFCARLAYLFLVSTSENSKTVNTILRDGNINELNSLTAGSFITTSESNSFITRYCNAMISLDMLGSSDVKTNPETTSDSQKLWNHIMKEAYTKLSDDPQAYVLHSYYDMLTNDKRGRLIRAFPTYYIVFMDEGRKIGSWKLFDNFYNMSAISEITVSKSRKLPADTCSFVMSNMYSSYAGEYDTTTRQQYVDVYGLRDVFDSIFAPKTYFAKEDSLRRRESNLETVVLQAGVRVHVRMGYGSDASKLPVAFNGKIAEVDVNEVVQVVAQGDGIELYNQLNTLGEMEATSISEAQNWFTWFKDFRGSMRRGGESPRNLLSKLLTAQYGGAIKTVIREWSDYRFYGDNPFGIYHFGDKRFNQIFDEGEVVQNLYEVCDATLLKGSNELYTSEENVMATPTINTSIQDKTFWDLLQLCANSGVNYIGAIRDFDMRSTVCLCKPNHYYAYTYAKIDDENGNTNGKIIEKRKPFQQFHYYDSYTDIVYNSIKASEKNMKTNAVGLWESTDLIWGKSQDTVGPIYLDMNIYPEYQKSMTVDTTLIADGNGGIDIPILTHFAEQWDLSEKGSRVNKSLAERVTTNVLRESVSNMYCGELCVLGDTSIKPHDRFYLNDTYEDMMGHLEVEGVVYSMNSSTGFTTTIYPDAIVRIEDDHEPARRMINGNFLSSLVVAVNTRLLAINTFARIDSAIVRALSNVAVSASSTTADEAILIKLGETAIGKMLHIEKASSVLGALKSAATSLATGTISITSVATTIVAAACIYVCANNVKNYITRWMRNIQALTVYPITKNSRPLLAGMTGHKGSVYGYPYKEIDGEDSIQGLVCKTVDSIDSWPFGTGTMVKNLFIASTKDENGNKVSEYDRLKAKWSQTLPLEADEPLEYKSGEEQSESLLQNLYTSVSNEFRTRSSMIQALRTQYRIPNLKVSKDDKTADEVYKKYHISNIKTLDALQTDNKILSLYPIEDDIDIKKAVDENSHPIIKQLYIAHAHGNEKVNIPFESGNRTIKLFATYKKDTETIYDLPMIQEDALLILKLILNEEALRNKQVSFLSGTRVNDTKTWKSTGFAFIISCDDLDSLKKAIDNVKEATSWLNGAKNNPIFEYKSDSEGFLVIVYAPKNTYN